MKIYETPMRIKEYIAPSLGGLGVRWLKAFLTPPRSGGYRSLATYFKTGRCSKTKTPGLPPHMGRWSQSHPYSKPPWSGGFTVGDTSGTLGVIDLVATILRDSSIKNKNGHSSSHKASQNVSTAPIDRKSNSLSLG